MKKSLLLFGAVAMAISANAQQRVPLFEVFTSSTCGPCNPGNQVYENVLNGKNPDDYVSVKYQQDFPGTGDPYATSESVNRRSSYYAINSIPRMEIDGQWDQNAQSFSQSLYDQYRNIPATATLSGTYTSNSAKEVTAKITYKATAALTGATLHAAILETVTYKNKKSNGETEFFHVVKKMMPNQSGTSLGNLAVNATNTVNLTYKFEGAYRLPSNGQSANRINLATENSVEDSSHLKVVCWIQTSDKKVAQAANLTREKAAGVAAPAPLADCKVFPNPANNAVNVTVNSLLSGNVSASLINMNGAVVATKMAVVTSGSNTISIDTQNLPAGAYTLVVLDAKNNSFGQMVTVSH